MMSQELKVGDRIRVIGYVSGGWGDNYFTVPRGTEGVVKYSTTSGYVYDFGEYTASSLYADRVEVISEPPPDLTESVVEDG